MHDRRDTSGDRLIQFMTRVVTSARFGVESHAR
jgi:hypothetical protein